MGRITTLFLMFLTSIAVAQPLATVNVDQPAKPSLDRYGNLYLSDQAGNIHKYDEDGQFLLTFSPPRPGTVALLESWNTVKIMVFYKVFQRFLIMDRFLTQVPYFDFDPLSVGFARVATLAADENIWLVDDTDFSLKKFNPRLKKLELVTPLDLILDPREYDVRFAREYQNQLYLSDHSSGILVFDNLGSYRKKIPIDSIDYFSFYGDELYCLKSDQIRLFHLYQFDERIIPLPAAGAVYALLSEKRLILCFKDRIEWWPRP